MRHRIQPATREPDRYGIAVGDLIAGTDVTRQSSHVGVVTEIIPYRPYVGMSGNRYHVRCGELYSTGEVIERVMHDHPLVIVPAGNPVVCATCSGKHAGADRFIECLVAHLRAEVERKAAACGGGVTDGRHLETVNQGMAYVPREGAIIDHPAVAALHRAAASA